MVDPIQTIAVIGYGSIAKKHIDTLQRIDPLLKILVYTRQTVSPIASALGSNVHFYNDFEIIRNSRPDVAMIATAATGHSEFTRKLSKTTSNIIIEKPITENGESALKLTRFLKKNRTTGVVAYNLRFLEGLNKIKKLLTEKQLGTIQRFEMSVGHDLKNWRPGIDYKNSVSAKKSLGGGVLRELSHELDLANHLFGKPIHHNTILARLKYVSLDVEDTVLFQGAFQKTDLILGSITMDFTRVDRHRTLTLLGSEKTLHWDINRGTVDLISAIGCQRVFNDKNDLNNTYSKMWKNLLESRFDDFCTLNEATETMNIIDDAENNGHFFEKAVT